VKRKILRVSPEFLEAIFAGGIKPCTSAGWPEDARIVDVRWYRTSYVNYWIVEFLVESESFDPVPIGGEFPEMTVLFTTKEVAVLDVEVK
jgi:hypothetical protein